MKMDRKAHGASASSYKIYINTLLASGRLLQIRTFHSWFAALLSTARWRCCRSAACPRIYELLEDDAPPSAAVWRPFLAAGAGCKACAPTTRPSSPPMAAVRRTRRWRRRWISAEFQLADEAGIVAASVPPLASSTRRWRAGLSGPGAGGRGGRALAGFAARGREQQDAAKGRRRRGGRLWPAWTWTRGWTCCAGLLRRHGRPADEEPGEVRPAQEAEPELTLLCAARAQHQAWQHQGRMARLSRCLIACFAQLKRERGWVDMNDVERTALTLLSDPIPRAGCKRGWMRACGIC